MAVLALIVAGVMLFFANFIFRWPAPRRSYPDLRRSILVLPLLIGVFCFPVWELAAALVILASIYASSTRRWPLHAWSVAAALGVFGLNALVAWTAVTALQRQYPYQSLEARLSERTATEEQPLRHDNYWSEVEQQLVLYSGSRTESLRDLHEDAVRHFISKPNFGVNRMSDMRGRVLQAGRLGSSIPLRGPRSSSAGTWDEVGETETVPMGSGLYSLQRDLLVDFVNPQGFGYAKDRRHIAGFIEHGFTNHANTVQISTLELVGLVVHPKPVVYLSDNLPRMDELRKGPTRDLNAFETAGLTKLREGDDLFVHRMPDDSLRMLGAVRALKQCTACHGGARGDLLGAFSYDLRSLEAK